MISESDKYFRVLLHCRQSIDNRQTKYRRGLDKVSASAFLLKMDKIVRFSAKMCSFAIETDIISDGKENIQT